MTDPTTSAEPHFPQLAVARDPARMAGVLRAHLRSPDGAAYEVLACRTTFVRDRTAGRALLRWAVRLADPASGREWEQDVSGVAYGGGRTRRVWDRLRRAAPAPVAVGDAPPLAPFAYVPELDLLLQVFPHDHRLPALAGLLAGPPAGLAAALPGRLGPGDWRFAGWAAEVARYRVDQRACVRVEARVRDAASGREEGWRFYAKVYREEAEGAQAHRLLGELRDAGGGAFAVAEPAAWLAGPRVLVQEEAPGVPLFEILAREEEAVPAVRRTARALAALHRSGVGAPERRSLRDELTQLEQAAALLRRARPELGARVGAVVAAVADALPEVALPTHGDLKPGHVLLAGDRVVLLDFDKLAAADPLRDPADLLAIVAKMELRGRLPGERAAAVGLAFREEYFARVPAGWRDRFPAREALSLLVAAANAGRGVRERSEREVAREDAWVAHVPALLAAAEAALVGEGQ